MHGLVDFDKYEETVRETCTDRGRKTEGGGRKDW